MTTFTGGSKIIDLYFENQIMVQGTPRIKIELTATVSGNVVFQYKFYSDASFTQFTSETGYTTIVDGYNIIQLDNPPQLYAIGRLSVVLGSSINISSLKINDVEHITSSNLLVVAPLLSTTGFGDGYCQLYDIYYKTQLIENSIPRIKIEMTTTLVGNAAFQYKYYSDASFTQFTNDTSFTSIENGYNIIQVDNPDQLYAIGRLYLIPGSSLIVTSLKINDVEHITTGNLSIVAPVLVLTTSVNYSTASTKLYKISDPSFNVTFQIQNLSGTAYFEYLYYTDETYTTLSYTTTTPIVNGTTVSTITYTNLYVLLRFRMDPFSSIQVTSFKLKNIEQLASTRTYRFTENTTPTLFTTLGELGNQLLTPMTLTYGFANTGILNIGSALSSTNLLGPAYGTTNLSTDNSSSLATTAFVKSQGYSIGGGSLTGYAQLAVAQTWSALQTFTGIQSSAYNALTATSTLSLGSNLTTGILGLGTSTCTINQNVPFTPTYSSAPTSTQIGYTVYPADTDASMDHSGRYKVLRYLPVVQGTYMATVGLSLAINVDYLRFWIGALKITPSIGLDITDYSATDHLVFYPSVYDSTNSTNILGIYTILQTSCTIYIPSGYTSLILGASLLKSGNPTATGSTRISMTRIA